MEDNNNINEESVDMDKVFDKINNVDLKNTM